MLFRKLVAFSRVCACGRRTFNTFGTKDTSVRLVRKGSEGLEEVTKYGWDLAELENIEKKSLARGLILNKFDNKSMIYPEFSDTDDFNTLEEYCIYLEKLLKDIVNSKSIDHNREMPSEVLNTLGKSSVYGLCYPKEYGGLGLGNKVYARVCEALAADWSVYSTFSNQHDTVIYALEKYGNEEQKRYYIPKLISGQMTGALCLQEEGSGQEIDKMTTEALRTDANTWKITGRKAWVTNGRDADLYLVFAKPIPIAHSTDEVDVISCFLVEKDKTDGVKAVRRQETIGLRGVQIWDVEFENVFVNDNAVMGIDGHGFEMAMHMLTEARQYGFGAAVVGFMRRLISVLSKYCVETSRFERLLADVGHVKHQMADMAVQTYALESLVYYVAGILDEEPEKQMDIENAVIQRFAMRLLRESVLSAIEIMGSRAATTRMDYERLLRDAVTLSALSLGDGMQTNLVGMSTVTLWADYWAANLSANADIYNRFIQAMHMRRVARAVMGAPKLKHYINEMCHPSLKSTCHEIEAAMSRFEAIVMKLVSHFGKEIEDEHLVLERIVDCVTQILLCYSMAARVTRSYSIGVRNAELELTWTHAFAVTVSNRMKKLTEELFEDQIFSYQDPLLNKISESVFEEGGYTIESPLQRNW